MAITTQKSKIIPNGYLPQGSSNPTRLISVFLHIHGCSRQCSNRGLLVIEKAVCVGQRLTRPAISSVYLEVEADGFMPNLLHSS